MTPKRAVEILLDIQTYFMMNDRDDLVLKLEAVIRLVCGMPDSAPHPNGVPPS